MNSPQPPPSAPAVRVRLGTRADVPAVVRLLADDFLGRAREDAAEPIAARYLTAYDAMTAQPGNELLVLECDGVVVGCLQLTLIAGLSHQGLLRGQIEGVRVASTLRGRGLGEQLLRAAIARAQAAGCGLVQLTTNQKRVDAQRFYQRLGFIAGSIGMKLNLDGHAA